MDEYKDLFLIYLGRSGAGPKITLELTKEIIGGGKIKNFNLLISKENLLLEDIKKIKYDLLWVSTPSKKIETLTKLPYFKIKFLQKLRKSKNHTFLFPMTHIWNPVVMLMIRVLIKNPKIFFVCHDAKIHPGDKNSFSQSKIMQVEINLASHIFCLSENVKSILVKKYPKKEISVLPHPAFDFGIIKEVRELSQIPTFLFFGRVVEYKGLSLLIDSFLIAKEKLKGENRNIKLLIAGEGEIKERDLDKINQNRQEIEFINRYINEKEVTNIWDRSDICALTYTEASQSGVIAVAVNKAIPCLITPIEGLKEQTLINKEGKTFALMSPDLNPENIANSMIEILNENLYKKLSQNAISHQKELSWDKWVEEINKLSK